MKKIFNNTVNRLVLFLSFTLVSMSAFADAGETVDTLDYSKIVTRPDFWIGVVLFIGFITAALMLGREKKQQA